MLDKRSEQLLRIINRECGEGSYKVIEIEDLIKSMPAKFKTDTDCIQQLMGYLKNGEYVSIKYSDPNVYCVSPLPRGRKIFEAEQEESRSSKKKTLKVVFLGFLYLILIFGVSLAAAYIAK